MWKLALRPRKEPAQGVCVCAEALYAAPGLCCPMWGGMVWALMGSAQGLCLLRCTSLCSQFQSRVAPARLAKHHHRPPALTLF